MRRLVEIVSSDYSRKYFIQTNKVFGFIPYRWHISDAYDAEKKIYTPLVFNFISEAEKWLPKNYKKVIVNIGQETTTKITQL